MWGGHEARHLVGMAVDNRIDGEDMNIDSIFYSHSCHTYDVYKTYDVCLSFSLIHISKIEQTRCIAENVTSISQLTFVYGLHAMPCHAIPLCLMWSQHCALCRPHEMDWYMSPVQLWHCTIRYYDFQLQFCTFAGRTIFPLMVFVNDLYYSLSHFCRSTTSSQRTFSTQSSSKYEFKSSINWQCWLTGRPSTNGANDTVTKRSNGWTTR